MRTREGEVSPFVSLAEITEIELLTVRRMREISMGEHRSNSQGSGFDFVGLRDWQAGDKPSSIDWAQSTLNNFAPLVVREFEQHSTATVVAIADKSLSTRCGIDGIPIAAIVARAIATLGLSAVFFQDPFGLLTFEAGFENLAGVPPRTGKSHVVHCLEAYQHGHGLQEVRRAGGFGTTLAGYLRRRSLLPVISDFLFDDAAGLIRELASLNGAHDVFVILVDSAFAFELHASSAGWIEMFDVETGRARIVSRQALAQMGDRIRDWQSEVRRLAHDAEIDVVQVGLDQTQSDIALSQFVAERRLQKTSG